MTDAALPGGEAGGGHDPWAPPESRPSLDKNPAPDDAPRPPSVHDQATVTSMPSDGFAAPDATAPTGPAPGYGYPPPGPPTFATSMRSLDRNGSKPSPQYSIPKR